MEWVASTAHTTSELMYPALLPLMRTPRLPVVDCTDAPVDLNGLVCFAERRNLVSARVPSHFYLPAYRHASYWIGWFRQRLWYEALNRSDTEMPCVTVTGLVMTPRREADAV
jgi:hypothetical protein